MCQPAAVSLLLWRRVLLICSQFINGIVTEGQMFALIHCATILCKLTVFLPTFYWQIQRFTQKTSAKLPEQTMHICLWFRWHSDTACLMCVITYLSLFIAPQRCSRLQWTKKQRMFHTLLMHPQGVWAWEYLHIAQLCLGSTVYTALSYN